MAKIAIVGAGQLGVAVAKILLSTTDHELVVIDIDEDQLQACIDDCLDIDRPGHRVAFAPTIQLQPILISEDEDFQVIFEELNPTIVVCAASPDVTVNVALAAARHGCHYLDFCADEAVVAAIQRLQTTSTFIPATGLAPGLATYIGLSLFDELDLPLQLSIRVGAVPQVSSGPAHFALTFSSEDLAQQLCGEAVTKVNQELLAVPARSGVESVIINSCVYEAFEAATLLGPAKAFHNIPTVSIKLLRYPGHAAWLDQELVDVADVSEAASRLEKLFYTKDDLVIIAAQAVDLSGFSSTSGVHFYPNRQLALSATELATAGTACGLIELIVEDGLPSGVLTALDIPFKPLLATQAVSLIFENAS